MISEHAYAKLNLTLEVIRKREDGYHDLASIIQTVQLHDVLEFSDSETIDFECSDETLAGDDNLVLQAAETLQKVAGVRQGAKINLNKRIPVSAGLGGGSADAAATLRGLNRLWNLGLSETELVEIATEVGSDVPFLVCGGTAIVSGRGERLERLPAPEHGWFVIVSPRHSGVATRHSGATTGHSGATTGHSGVTTGHSGVITRHSDVTTGHSDVTTGHSDVITRHSREGGNPEGLREERATQYSDASKTARMFGMLSPTTHTTGSLTRKLAARMIEKGDCHPTFMFNVFQQLAPHAFTHWQETFEAFARLGASDIVLTGAGPSMFAIAPSKEVGTAWALLAKTRMGCDAFSVGLAPRIEIGADS